MIWDNLQLVCCLLLVVVAIRWKVAKTDAALVIRTMLILGTVAGICGLVNLYQIGMNLFIVFYSSPLCQIQPPSNLVLLGVFSAMTLSALPLLCVIPNMARDPKRMLWISSISLASLLGLWMFRHF